jgi:intracellular septation protein
MTETQTPSAPPSAPTRQWIRTLVDFGALAAFIGTHLITRDLQKATVALVIGSVVALAVGYLAEKRLAPMPAIAGGFAIVFGVLTLVFHNDDIIKMKVTFVNVVFAGLLLGGIAIGRNPAKLLLGETLKMSDAAWRTLAIRYALYFLTCAIANEVIWRTQNDDVWMAFRTVLWITALVFAFAQIPFIMKEMKASEAPPPETPDPLP